MSWENEELVLEFTPEQEAESRRYMAARRAATNIAMAAAAQRAAAAAGGGGGAAAAGGGGGAQLPGLNASQRALLATERVAGLPGRAGVTYGQNARTLGALAGVSRLGPMARLPLAVEAQVLDFVSGVPTQTVGFNQTLELPRGRRPYTATERLSGMRNNIASVRQVEAARLREQLAQRRHEAEEEAKRRQKRTWMGGRRKTYRSKSRRTSVTRKHKKTYRKTRKY
jgi:hypothetical protein